MKIPQVQITLFTFLCLLFVNHTVEACSMYKLTADGKTMVGCNEDAWRSTSRIWFKTAPNTNEYGAAFTGSRQVSLNRTTPQSGMNEAGLTFSRLESYYPLKDNPFPNRLPITDEVDYLTNILHKCATIEEVKKYIEQYDHSLFIDDVFIYIDRSGKYLVVEPYHLIEGNDPYYVLSNFCPSITDPEEARILERYRNGEDYLKTHRVIPSLAFCTAVSDTMHVCRNRNGDGTLLTSIWDTKDGLVNLYFYHSFESTVQFNLAKELSKGNHELNVPDLFPKNAEFERLKSYKTPFNTPPLRVALAILGVVLTLLAFLMSITAIGSQNAGFSLAKVIPISIMNLLLTVYLFVLATNIYIFYFDAPYQHYSSNWISISSYTPFLLLLIILPVTLFTQKQFKSAQTKSWIKTLLLSNNIIYLLLLVSFGYWGLFSVWN